MGHHGATGAAVSQCDCRPSARPLLGRREFGLVQVTGLTQRRFNLHQLHPRHSRAAGRLDAHDIEQRILRTYVQLAITPERPDGSRCATLARLGTLEVRLTECGQPARALPAEPPFWLEIYSDVMGSTVERCGCFKFDEAELATATELICEVCAGLERELPSSGANQ